jgi:hypothetical protein
MHFAGKTGRVKAVLKPLGLLLVAGSLFAGCSKLPEDNVNVQLIHFKNLHATRYAEVFLVGGNSLTGNLRANVYNTTYLNGYNQSNKDSVPQALAQAVNPEEIKKQYDVLGVKLNGPKLWMLDWIDCPVGVERDFNGLKARWVGELNLKGINLKDEAAMSYHPTTIERKTKFGYNGGTMVYLIDDAEGNTWIMKGFEQGLKPTQTYEDAKNLGSQLKLPAGWKFRTRVLDEDLVLIPATGIATIMPDDHFNVYDKTGPGYSNYKP